MINNLLLKRILIALSFVVSCFQGISQTPLYSAVKVSDVGTSNNIGQANTSRNVAVDASGNIGVVYIGSAGLRFAKSVNRGQSFMPSVQLNNATSGNTELQVADNGNIYVIFSNGSTLVLYVSLDGGTTFSSGNTLGTGSTPHIASYGSNVYVVTQNGSAIYSNANNGIGAFTKVTLGSWVYADIRVDKSNGDVYMIADNPTLYMFRSTNSGASFTFVPISGSVFYSSYTITNGPLGKFIYVAGSGNVGYKINFATGASNSVAVGLNASSQARTLESDEFGNFVDGYAIAGTTMGFHVSYQGGAYGALVSIPNSTSHNLARNSATQDIDVVYSGTDGMIYLNTYPGMLRGLTTSNVNAFYCPGATGTVSFSQTGAALNADNVYQVQLSDANRSFANPVTIGTLTSTASAGTINFTIPANTASGTQYRIRVVSTSPATTGADNLFDISINAAPTAQITTSGATTICQGNPVLLASSTGSSYLWSNGATTSAISVNDPGNYTVTVGNGCGLFATSAPTKVNVTLQPTISASGPTTFCTPGTIALTASAGTSYLWSNNATTQSINVGASGTYTVKVTGGGCAITSAPLTVVDHDVIAPQFVSAATILTANLAGVVNATSANGAVVNYTLPSATDNCTINPTVTAVPASGSVFPIGNTTVNVTAVDNNGNSTQTSFVVTVAGLAPSIVVPQTITVNNTAGSCSAIVNFVATETTGIPASIITYDIAPGTVFNVGTTRVTATATNAIGSSSQSFDVVVKDTELPKVLTNDVSVYLDANGNASVTAAQINNGSTDNCGIAIMSVSPNSFNCADLTTGSGNAVMAYTGATTRGVQNYSGVLGMDFDVVNPSGILISQLGAFDDGGNGITGNQAGGSIRVAIFDRNTQTIVPGFDVSIAGSVDPLQNGHRMHSITSVTLPVGNYSIVALGYNNSELNGNAGFSGYPASNTNNNGGAIVFTGGARAGGTIFSFPTSVDGGPASRYHAGTFTYSTAPAGKTVVLSVTDIHGNTGTATANITVLDNIAPTISCPGNISVSNDPGQCSATVVITNATATDNCSVKSIVGVRSDALSLSAPYPKGITTIVWTATDASGNQSTCTETITVTDTEPPVIAAVANINVFATSAAGALVNYAAPIGTDNCLGATTVMTAGLTSGSTFPIGVTVVTYTVTDASGLTASTSFNITVVGIAPVVVAPSNYLVNNETGKCGASVNFAATETTAIPASTITYTENGITLVSGAFFTVGTHTITATATNAVGSNSATFTITVNDTELPTITAPASITVTADAGLCAASKVNLGLPITADNCAVATTTNDAAATFPVGTTTVTWTVTDIHGNVSTATQTVTVTDDELPVIVNTPINITQVNDKGNCGAVVSWTAATASDNCPGVTISSDHQSGETFPVGTTTVTYTATDAHGHSVTSSFTITVNDTELPSISTTDKTQTADAGVCKATVTVATPVTTDNCGVASVTNSINGTNNASGVYPVGTTVITWTVTDIHGNVNTTVQNITVNDDEKPIAQTQNITIQLDVNGAAIIVPAQINNGSTDNCGIASYSLDRTSFYCSNVGANIVTLTVTDIHGNVSSATAVVTVQDRVAPVARAKNITLGLGTAVGGLVNITAADVNNGSSDACGIASMSVVPASFGCGNVGANTVTLTVTDNNANTSTTTAIVTVVDDKGPVPTVATLPTITGQCYATALTLKPGEEGGMDDGQLELENYYLVVPTAMDNCSGLAKGTTTDPLTYYNQGTYTIHWKYVDAKGNVTIQPQTVIVKDTQAPTPKRAVLPTLTGQCSVSVVAGSNGEDDGEDGDGGDSDHGKAPWALDNCSGWIKGTTTDPLTYTVQGTYTITWSYNDGHGNISTQTQTVIVKDITKPKIKAPNDKSVTCGSSILPAVTGMATATDNCSTPVITFTDVNNGTQITRTWKATDAAGNTSTSVQLIKLTPAFSATLSSTPTSTTYTGGSSTNLYLGYGAQSTKLSINGLPSGNYTYTWTSIAASNLNSTTAAAPIFTATASGVYTFTVTISNGNGCSNTASISICVTDVRVAGSNGALIYVCHQGTGKSGGTQTLSVPVAQVAAHLNNTCGGKGGDRLGSCSTNPCNTNTEISAVDPKTQEVVELKSLKSDVIAAPVEDLKVMVMPNPSTTYFTLKFASKDMKTQINLRVMDASGRAIEAKQEIDPSSTIQIGYNYPSGTFYVEVIQGNQRKVVQMIKARG